MKSKIGMAAVAVVLLVTAVGGGATATALITSKQIKDHTIKTRDLSPKTVTALKGDRGPQGLSGTFKSAIVVREPWEVGDNGKTAVCPARTIVVSGGIENRRDPAAPGVNPWDYAVLQSFPSGNGWYVEVYSGPDTAGSKGNTLVWTYAVCAS